MAFGAMAFACNRIFRLSVVSLCVFKLLLIGLLFKFRCTVDMPAVVADECVGLLCPGVEKFEEHPTYNMHAHQRNSFLSKHNVLTVFLMCNIADIVQIECVVLATEI